MSFNFVEQQVDDKVVDEIKNKFNGFFTEEQIIQTLIANQYDKAKTINDLKYKEGKLTFLSLGQLKKKNKDNIKQVIH